MKTADLERTKHIHRVPKYKKKTKHRLPARGQVILEERCNGKHEIESRVGEIPRHVHTGCIQNTCLDSEYVSFHRRTFWQLATQDVFTASLCQPQLRSGTLLLPHCNHGRGADATEWDPIIEAFVHSTERVREGERVNFYLWIWPQGEQSHLCAFCLECSRWDGIHINNPEILKTWGCFSPAISSQ